MAAVSFYGTGKRKTSIARVWLKPGAGAFTVNNKTLDDYFGRETSKMVVTPVAGAYREHRQV